MGREMRNKTEEKVWGGEEGNMVELSSELEQGVSFTESIELGVKPRCGVVSCTVAIGVNEVIFSPYPSRRGMAQKDQCTSIPPADKL